MRLKDPSGAALPAVAGASDNSSSRGLKSRSKPPLGPKGLRDHPIDFRLSRRPRGARRGGNYTRPPPGQYLSELFFGRTQRHPQTRGCEGRRSNWRAKIGDGHASGSRINRAVSGVKHPADPERFTGPLRTGGGPVVILGTMTATRVPVRPRPSRRRRHHAGGPGGDRRRPAGLKNRNPCH